jgi:two-component system NtrC family sensor kinase
MGLRNKILILTIGLILLLGLSFVIFAKTTLTKNLVAEFEERGIFLTRLLAEMSVDNLLTENNLRLQLEINRFKKENHDIEYIFVLDANGEVVAHTFEKGFPVKLKTVNNIDPNRGYSVQHLSTDVGEVIDIAAPMLKSRAGTVHVGFSEEPLKKHIDYIIKLILLMIAGVVATGGGIAVVFASVITKPVFELTETAREISKGNLDHKVHVRTKDEIGELGSTFNKMINDLKETTVSRQYLDNVINSMMDSVVVIDTQSKIKSVNQSIVDLLGYSKNELIGKPFSMLFADKEICERSSEILAKTGHISNIEAYYKTKNGKEIPVILSASIIKGDLDNLDTIVVNAKDITERKKTEDELRQSYQFTKTVLNSMNDAVFIIDVESFTIVGVNRVFLEEYGLSEQEVIGRRCYEITHKQSSPCAPPADICPLLKTKTTGRHAVTEHEHITRNDKKRYVEISTSPIFDETGRLIQAVHVAKDITEHKLAEQQLQQKQQELIVKHEELNKLFREVEIANKERQKIMDSMDDMIILADSDGKIRRCNRAVAEFTQKSFKEILGTSWEELIYENGLEAVAIHADSTELIHEPSRKWFSLKAYIFEDTELDFSGTVITIHETTQMKNITEQLERTNRKINANRRKLQAALNEISSLMQNVTEETSLCVRFNNPNLIKCYEVKNCTKKDCFCYGKEAMRCWQIAGTYCGGEVQGAFAQKYNSCSECEVFKHAFSDPIYQIGEHFNNMMYVIETKNRQLEEAYKELKATQSTILQHEKMASIGQLAAGIAHEINNPMGFISSNLGTLQKYVERLTEFIRQQSETLTAINNASVLEQLSKTHEKLKISYILKDAKELIKESLEGAERVKKIVQNLKSFSRVDEAEYKYADINECIESTLNIVWNELKYKATVKKEYGDIPPIKCYPQQLNQVFMNLLINAAHAIEKQGEIRIKTWNGKKTINISISDTGCGIPEDNLGRIFEPFFTTKEVGKGTGLGLSISYDIIKKHNGEITVESEVGKGTTFTLSIPVVDEK